MEIERKYRIDCFPGEGRLAAREGSGGLSGLHRHVADGGIRAAEARRPERRTTYTLTFKGEGTLVRQEIELPLEEATFFAAGSPARPYDPWEDYRVYALPTATGWSAAW